MNRIVIIGNGFDLAHELKTKYSDFVLYLVNQSLKELDSSNNTFSEELKPLFTIRKNPAYLGKEKIKVEFNSIDSFLNKGYVQQFIGTSAPYKSPPGINIAAMYNLYIHSVFFSRLLSKINWADFEKTYFDMLSGLYDNQTKEIIDTNALKTLNEDFEFIKENFIRYIRLIENENADESLHLYKAIEICCDLNSHERLYGRIRSMMFEGVLGFPGKGKVVFVNFNYTNTLKRYNLRSGMDNVPNEKDTIHIHGEVKDPKSIIFGYGDEMNDFYKDLEDLDNHEVLKHFKSPYYGNNYAYQKLLFEIEASGNYEVMVIGHSLGLSDRVLLNKIFENDNCKAIHLFHRGDESHFKKRVSLSRHFDNKQKFREKLVEENPHFNLKNK